MGMLEQYPALGSFLAHWRTLPREGLVPTLGAYLDNPPVALQPYVAISDLVSADDTTIRLMGTALAHAVGERTGTDIKDSYGKDIARYIRKLAWTAVSHPAGYLARRGFARIHGLPYTVQTITLPLIGKSVPHCVVTYFGLDYRDYRNNDPKWLDQSVGCELQGWVDIGAGIPKD